MKPFRALCILVSTVFTVTSHFATRDDTLFYNITVLAEENRDNVINFDIINVNFYNLGGDLKKNYTGLTIKHQSIYDIQQGAVSNLAWIQYVRFENAEIEEIRTGAFFNLPFLKILSIIGNPLLKNITDGVFECWNLTELYLYNNSIEHISSHAFAGVPQLQVIGLDINNIKRINHKWFVPTRYLFIIFLNYNKLSKIREKDLRTLQGIVYNGLKLNFSHNKLRKLEEGVFRGMVIDDLNLSNNNLKRLNFGVFEDSGKLRHVDLTGNDIVCTNRIQLIRLFSFIESITKNDGWDESCVPPMFR